MTIVPRRWSSTARSRLRPRKSASRARRTTPNFRARRWPIPRGRRGRTRRSRPGRILRQAAAQVRAADRNLSGLRTEGPELIPHRAADLAAREAFSGAPAARRAAAFCARLQARRKAGVRRASSKPRRLGVLPVTLRRGRDPDHGRGRRMGHHHRRLRSRQPDRDRAGDSFPAFAWSALLGLHLLSRFQGQRR